MKKSSLNRKFRRALAASLGAVAFASTSCVINAVDQKLIKQREVAKYLGERDDLDFKLFNLGATDIDVAILSLAGINVNGEHLSGIPGTKKEITADKDYEVKLSIGGQDIDMTVRLKRRQMLGGGHLLDLHHGAADHYRLCPNIDGPIRARGLGTLSEKTNRWVRDEWNKYYTALDTKIQNLEKEEAKKAEDARIAEENARAERERMKRMNSMVSSSNNNTPVTAPANNNFNPMLAPGILAPALLPMMNTTPQTTTNMMNTPSSVQTATGSTVTNPTTDNQNITSRTISQNEMHHNRVPSETGGTTNK